MDKEFQIACEMNYSPCGFGSPGRRLCYYRRRSRATTLKFLVERCGSLGGSILLVEYIILQSIKLTLFASFGTSGILFGFFKIFAKKWKNQLTPLQKINNVYSVQIRNASTYFESSHKWFLVPSK